MKVLFVCLGNICRSPMAEGLWRKKLAARGLVDAAAWDTDSAGTGGHHAGEGADPRTIDVLRRVGADFPHTARQVTRDDFLHYDVLFAMDGANLRDLRRLVAPEAPGGPGARVERVLSVTTGGDVPDPWYGGPEGFDEVHDLLDDALERWLARFTA